MDAEREIEIVPEPAEEVRDAILAAVRQVDGDDRESAWWRAGVAEAVATEPE